MKIKKNKKRSDANAETYASEDEGALELSCQQYLRRRETRGTREKKFKCRRFVGVSADFRRELRRLHCRDNTSARQLLDQITTLLLGYRWCYSNIRKVRIVKLGSLVLWATTLARGPHHVTGSPILSPTLTFQFPRASPT